MADPNDAANGASLASIGDYLNPLSSYGHTAPKQNLLAHMDYSAIDMNQLQAALQNVPDSRFQLLSILGEGEFGTVWRAKDLQQGGIVAVKTLKKSFFLFILELFLF
jgi:serine/threonine protein kinase